MAGQADDFTHEFELEDAPEASPTTRDERETDSHRLAQRQKQVDFGKNTVGYQRYLQEVPKAARTKKHPRTPDVSQKVSKRAFDGQIRKWRRELHAWDIPGPTDATATADATDASKNGQGQRQPAGLPLKIPSAMRPAVAAGAGAAKRPRSFLAALLSPTAAPPEAKQPRRAEEEAPAAGEPGPAAHPSHQLMAKWREMGESAAAAAGSGAAATEEAIEVEVSYSEDEDETVPMQAEPLPEAVAA